MQDKIQTLTNLPIEPRRPEFSIIGHNHFDHYSLRDKGLLLTACHLSFYYHQDKKRKSGESYYLHDCRTAGRLLKAQFPVSAIVSQLLGEFIEDDGWSKRRIEECTTHRIAEIIDGLSKRPKSKFPDPGGRDARVQNHIKIMKEKVLGGYWEVAIAKTVDRLDNNTDTAALGDSDRDRMFRETDNRFLPFFRWSLPYIPKKYRIFEELWILEIEYACDNYWRSIQCTQIKSSSPA